MYMLKRDLLQPRFFSLIKKYALWGLIACGSLSCQFELEEIIPPDVSPPEADNFDITLIANDSSQLVIYKPTNFTFGTSNDSRFDFGSQDITITLNDEPIRNINYATFEESIVFTIDPRNFSDGTYTLRIASEFSFIGNNLAAMTNTSTSLLQEWEVVIDKTPDPIEITSVVIEDGELVVYWGSETIRNFDKMYLVGTSDNVYDSRAVEVDRLANSATFPYFIEGVLELEVRTSTDYDIMSIGTTYVYELEEDLVNFQLQDSTVSVTIKRPSLYKNVQSFTVNGTNYTSFDSDLISIELESGLLFGSVTEYAVTFLLGPQGFFYSYADNLGIGLDVPQFDDIIYSKANNAYYARHIDYLNPNSSDYSKGIFIYKIDAATIQVTDTLIIEASGDNSDHLAISPDGKLLITTLNYRNLLYELDPLTLEVIKTTNLETTYGYDEPGSTRKSESVLTSSGLLLIKGRTYMVIDILNEIEVFRGDFAKGGIIGQFGDLSPEGTFMFHNGQLYSNNGSSYGLVKEIDANNKTGLFLSETELIHFNETEAHILEIPSGIVLQSFTFEGNELASDFGTVESTFILDLNNRLFLSNYPSESIQVIDLNTQTSSNQSVSGGYLSYLNGTLFSRNGKALQIQLP
ncbi:YncE family protein [Ekhidna sp. To15]|uniref:YncE family protein n=1 Tax=Ekhidna sp. To15 TaxID=3395267 RepID=UPI003F52349C